MKRAGQKPVREADLKPPKEISTADFNELLDAYSIEGAKRDELKDFMQELVTHFRDRGRQQRKERTGTQDRRSIKLAAKRILQAKDELERCEAAGRQVLRFAAKEHLSATFSLHWLRCHFPGDDLIPSDPRPQVIVSDRPQRGHRTPVHTPLRTPQHGADADTLYALYNFARQRGPELISAVLTELYESLLHSNEQRVEAVESRHLLGIIF